MSGLPRFRTPRRSGFDGSKEGPFEALRLRAPNRSPRDLPRNAKIEWIFLRSLGLTLPYATIKFPIRRLSDQGGATIYIAKGPDGTIALSKSGGQLVELGHQQARTDHARFHLSYSCNENNAPETIKEPTHITANFPMFGVHRVQCDRPDARRIARPGRPYFTAPSHVMRKFYLDQHDKQYRCVNYQDQDLTGQNLLLQQLKEGGEWKILDVVEDLRDLSLDGKFVLQVYKEEERRETLNKWLQVCCANAMRDQEVRTRTASTDADGESGESDTTEEGSDDAAEESEWSSQSTGGDSNSEPPTPESEKNKAGASSPTKI